MDPYTGCCWLALRVCRKPPTQRDRNHPRLRYCATHARQVARMGHTLEPIPDQEASR